MQPDLTTERLLLRTLRGEDLDFLVELRGDPEVTRFYPKAYTRSETKDWLSLKMSQAAEWGHGVRLACDRESGEPRGWVAISRVTVEDREIIELGYMFHRPYWRQGLASEAALACRDWAFESLHLDRLHALIRPVNLPSQGVARKLSMTAEPELVQHFGFEHFLFVLTRDQWRQLTSASHSAEGWSSKA